MNENKAIFAVATLLLAVALAIPAYAGPPAQEPEGSCPGGQGGGQGNYQRIPIDEAMDQGDAKAVDKPPRGNKDGFVCQRVQGGDAQYVDNNLPL